MIKKENKYILKAQRKKFIKKLLIIFLFFVMAVVLFITKSNFFIVKKVAITGNPIITGDDVKKRCERIIGENIFFVKKDDLIKEAKKNPYVDEVKVSKQYPKQININIVEKEGIYYVNQGKSKFILNNKLILLEKTDDIQGRNLVEVTGIDFQESEIGNTVLEDYRIRNILEDFYNVVKNNPTGYNVSCIDIKDLTDIKVYIGDIEGRLGNDENILDKMNKILHIVSNPETGITKGYIDVSFDGSPIYYKE
ncbi:cell division protein FtsQ [Clostridium uliginosum]|uniref:Cell division protein FtsQ n=2 Tax=Clostridium uliginosum TaxID=119641 RepID=A0A1I1NEB7_9CLOT|nr:cell division protein FtsQ [Clostridium uliginosum]